MASPLPGFRRSDAWLWAGGLTACVAGTLIAWAAGARLGAALTLGVGLLVLIVVLGVAIPEARALPAAEPQKAPSPPPAAGRGRVRPAKRRR
jgi:hypothetical protein